LSKGGRLSRSWFDKLGANGLTYKTENLIVNVSIHAAFTAALIQPQPDRTAMDVFKKILTLACMEQLPIVTG
jgi:hypothetical protein